MTTIDTEAFVGKTDYRDYLRQPSRFRDFVICSNGDMLIATPFVECDYPAWGTTVNPLEVVEMGVEHAWQPLGPLELNFDGLTKPCKDCGGRGKSTKKVCRECNGEGEVDLESDYNSYVATCKSCDGDGSVVLKGGDEPCKRCGGKGSVLDNFADSEKAVVICGIKINPFYAALINGHEGVYVCAGSGAHKLLFVQRDDSGADLAWGAIMGFFILKQ